MESGTRLSPPAQRQVIDHVAEPRLLALLKYQYESIQESCSWLADLQAEEVRRKSNAN
jgi:hypothetical protein